MAQKAPMVLACLVAMAAIGSAVFLPLHYSERAALIVIGAPVGALIAAQLAQRQTRGGAVLWIAGFAVTIAFSLLLVEVLARLGVVG